MSNPTPYAFAPEERPALPGTPFSPPHVAARRVGYAAAAIVTGIASTFGNALVNTNVPSLAGGLSVDVVELSWLPAVFVALNATANLTLVKARVQFGIPQVTATMLTAYALAAAIQAAAPSFAGAVAVRAADGLVAACLISLTVTYLMQAFPAKARPAALAIGVSLPQMGTPLARLMPVELLSTHHWAGLNLMELAVALIVLFVLFVMPLPPSERGPAFEPLDFVSIGMIVSAVMLLSIVLSEGRLVWWTDAPWIGWALAAAIVLLAAGLTPEHNRARPLLQTRWIAGVEILRFAGVALLLRIALAEQTYGAVGLLTAGGLTNDQLRVLFAIVAVAMVAGAAVAVLTLSERRLPWQVASAALIIALAAWMDSHATTQTRPAQLYLSQALLGFGTTLFIGPALVFGLLRVLRRGPDVFISLIVVFGITQNVGSIAGSALLGSLQVAAAHAHAETLSERLLAGDPQVIARLQAGAAALGSAIADPAARGAQGAGLLAQALNREAAVLAFNDVFSFVAALALTVALIVLASIAIRAVRNRARPTSEVGP